MRLHSYELEGRGRVTVALAILSILLVWLLDLGLKVANFEPQWWVSVPSFTGFYSVLFWLFDNHIWRWRLWWNLGLLRVPDLNGQWAGSVDSSYGPNGSTHSVSISITQKWSKLLVRFETQQSPSHSISGTLKVTDVVNPKLSYLYINQPRSSAPETMEIHRGTANLELKGAVLEGEYYTGRGRMTFGSIRLTRIKNERKGRKVRKQFYP